MIDIKDLFNDLHIPLHFIEKEKIYLTDEDDTYLLNFPVFNKKGEINNIQIPIQDYLKNETTAKKSSFEEHNGIKIKQIEENGEPLGINSKFKSKNLFFTSSPLDRLFLLSLDEENVINISPNILEDDNEFFQHINKRINLKEIEKVYLCFPNNSYKSKLEEFFSNRFDKYKILIMEYNFLNSVHNIEHEFKNLFNLFPFLSHEDNNEEENKTLFTKYYLKQQLLENCKTLPIKGIYNLVDFDNKINSIYKNGVKKGESTGWNNLDKYFTPKTKHVTVVYGIPQHGKSTFVKCLSLNLANTAKWKTAFFSFEDESPEVFYHEMIEKCLHQITPFHNTSQSRGRTNELLQEEKYVNAKKFVQQNIKLILPDENYFGDENFLDLLLSLFEQAINIYGIKNIVIDPWNQVIQGKPKHLSEAEYLSICLGKINRFAKQYDVHVIIVSHPKVMLKDENGDYKMPSLYDLSGGANWFNKISIGICIFRKMNEIESQINKISIIQVQKCKRRELGQLGTTFLTTLSNSETLVDNIIEDAFKSYLNSPKKVSKILQNFYKAKENINITKSTVTSCENIEDIFSSKSQTKSNAQQNKKINKDMPF